VLATAAALEDLLIDSFARLGNGRALRVWIAWRKTAFVCEHRRERPRSAGIRPWKIAEKKRRSGTPVSEEALARPCAASRREAAARLRAARDRERRVEKALTLTRGIAWPATRPGATPRGAGVSGKTKAVSGGGKRTGKRKRNNPGRRNPRLDYGPRGASDEDGRWRIPAGLQRAVRLRYAKRRGCWRRLSTTTVQTWARWRR